jgi:hypothetical protein
VSERPPKRTFSRALSSGFFGPLPHLSPDRRGASSSKAWNLLSDDVKASLQRAESNLNTQNTVDLGPKRPFSVGECALWARLSGPRFAGQVAAAVSLVKAPSSNCKAAAVAKEVMAISGSATGRAFRSISSSRRHSPANTQSSLKREIRRRRLRLL